PPKIVSHPPETKLLSEGEELRLGCKATGKPIPEVSWYKDYVELIEGKGSAEYLNQDVSRRDNGNYKCVARNNASQVEHTVQVIVRYKPVGTKIKTDAKSDTLETGEDLKIVCEADSKPNPIFDLFHHSEVGLGREVVKVQTTETGEFYIKNIKPSQRGNYSCIPHNNVGQGAEALVRVFVRFSPVIRKLSPTKLNLTKNEPLLISCDIEGYPLPQLTWTDGNGKNIGSERIFKIPHVHESDQGVYTCSASNGILPNANKSVHIKVF
ncbi:Receptor-type tyrosine- phosphatase alpha, partial [Paramuricea clavata]